MDMDHVHLWPAHARARTSANVWREQGVQLLREQQCDRRESRVPQRGRIHPVRGERTRYTHHHLCVSDPFMVRGSQTLRVLLASSSAGGVLKPIDSTIKSAHAHPCTHFFLFAAQLASLDNHVPRLTLMTSIHIAAL